MKSPPTLSAMSDPDRTVLVVCHRSRLEELASWLRTEYRVSVLSDRGQLEAELAETSVGVLEEPLPRFVGQRSSRSLAGPDSAFVTVVRSVERDGLVLHGAGTEFIDRIEGLETLVDRVAALRNRAVYDDLLAEYANLAARRGELETTLSPAELTDSEEYDAITSRLEAVLSELEAVVHDFERRDFEAAFETPDFTGGARIERAGWIS